MSVNACYRQLPWNSGEIWHKVLDVKRPAIMCLVLGVFVGTATGQDTVAQPKATNHFNWDWRRVQELDTKDSILRSKRLSPAERTVLVDAIAAQLRPSMGDLEIRSERELRQVAMETRITLRDLNGDGNPEVIAQGAGMKSGCSATGNCPCWIFKRVNSRYSILLSGQAQTFTVQPTKTRGFHDIVLGLHASAFEAELTVYKFDGTSYRDTACYDANWTYLGTDGESHHLHTPQITACGAAE